MHPWMWKVRDGRLQRNVCKQKSPAEISKEISRWRKKNRWRFFLDIEREKGFRNNLKLSSIIDGTEMRELKDEFQSYKGV